MACALCFIDRLVLYRQLIGGSIGGLWSSALSMACALSVACALSTALVAVGRSMAFAPSMARRLALLSAIDCRPRSCGCCCSAAMAARLSMACALSTALVLLCSIDGLCSIDSASALSMASVDSACALSTALCSMALSTAWRPIDRLLLSAVWVSAVAVVVTELALQWPRSSFDLCRICTCFCVGDVKDFITTKRLPLFLKPKK